jgi:thiol:disulfide interchange protein DsbC
MKKTLFILFAITAFSVSVAYAETQAAIHSKKKSAAVAKPPTEESVLAAFKKKYPSTTISAVHQSEIAGLFEISMGKNIAYTDKNAKYLMFGHIFDMDTQTDLTQAHLDELNKVDFSALPLDKSIKVVKGDGSRVFAVFTDPDCPYCKQFESNLKGIDNYTMYVFLFPIAGLHPEAEGHANAIWCAKDKVAAWQDYMLNSKLPEGKADCATPIQSLITLAQSLGVQGTPTLLRADGARAPGALSAPQLDLWLNNKKIQTAR